MRPVGRCKIVVDEGVDFIEHYQSGFIGNKVVAAQITFVGSRRSLLHRFDYSQLIVYIPIRRTLCQPVVKRLDTVKFVTPKFSGLLQFPFKAAVCTYTILKAEAVVAVRGFQKRLEYIVAQVDDIGFVHGIPQFSPNGFGRIGEIAVQFNFQRFFAIASDDSYAVGFKVPGMIENLFTGSWEILGFQLHCHGVQLEF